MSRVYFQHCHEAKLYNDSFLAGVCGPLEVRREFLKGPLRLLDFQLNSTLRPPLKGNLKKNAKTPITIKSSKKGHYQEKEKRDFAKTNNPRQSGKKFPLPVRNF